MKVFIVWGSPGSGKTTYVREHMEWGDLIVDLDLIKQSISMEDKTNASFTLLGTALSIREHLYDLIGRREVTALNAWVVAGLPKREGRIALKERLNADELIHIEATKEECIERAMKDDERTNKDLQMQIIDKWFRAYEPEWDDEMW